MGNAPSVPVDPHRRRGYARGGVGGAGVGAPLPRPSLQSQPSNNHPKMNNNNKQLLPQRNGAAGTAAPPHHRPPPQLTGQHPFFQIVSPASDVSNPSNFHHLKRRTQQTPVRDRRRASRVFHTQPARTRKGGEDGKPPVSVPHHFYLAEAEDEGEPGEPYAPPRGGGVPRRASAADAVAPPPSGAAGAPLQRVKRALAGCLQDAFGPFPANTHSVPRDHHHHYNHHRGGGGQPHIRLASTESMSPTDTPSPQARRFNEFGNDEELAAVPTVGPNTSGFIRNKPVDPDIPTSVECGVVRHRRTTSPLQFDPARAASAPFGRISEGDGYEDEPSTEGGGTRERTAERDSPVCLLFADEANLEPNFSTLETSRHLFPTNHPMASETKRSAAPGAAVVDESVYLNEHPSALDEPSRLLHVSGPVPAGPAMHSSSFAAERANNTSSSSNRFPPHHERWVQHVVQLGSGPANDVPPHHERWLQHVRQIQQQFRSEILQQQNRHRRSLCQQQPDDSHRVTSFSRSHDEASSTAVTASTGPQPEETYQEDATAAAERLRQTVAESVQRQIDAHMALASNNNNKKPSRGRSAEPRRYSSDDGNPYYGVDGDDGDGKNTSTGNRSTRRGSSNRDAPPRSRSASATPSAGRNERGRSKEPRDPRDHSQQHPAPVVTGSHGDHVQRLRQQFQRDGPSGRGGVSAARPSRDGTGRRTADEESIVARNRQIFEPDQSRVAAKRSTSMPPSPEVRPVFRERAPSLQQQQRSRSLSVPPGESKSSFPALLQLAGWVPPPARVAVVKPPPPPESSAPKPLPGLLQLSSSWNSAAASSYHQVHHVANDPNKRLSDPFPLRRSAPAGTQKNHRYSEPLPQRRVVAPEPVPVQVERRGASQRLSSGTLSQSIAVQTSPSLVSETTAALDSDAPALPPDRSIKDNHLTIAHMLAQTYPLGRVSSFCSDDDDNESGGHQVPSASYMQFTYVAPTSSRADQPPALLPSSNNLGVMSALATESISPSTAVTGEASTNAAFLFESDENGNYPSSHAARNQLSAPPSFHITTLESLHRVSGLTPAVQRLRTSRASSTMMPPTPHAVESLTMPPRSEQLSAGEAGSTPCLGSADGTNRHVRFSDSTQKREAFRAVNRTGVTVTTFPEIDSKLSDLTDTNNITTSRSFDSAASSKNAIREEESDEDDDDDDTTTHADTVIQARPAYEPESEATETPEEVSAKNWAYSSQGLNRVTPFRTGSTVGVGAGTQITNSPYVRFKEARSKFTGGKAPPIKKSSPLAKRKWSTGASAMAGGARVSGGLVHQRIAAMEAARNNVPESHSPARAAPVAIPQRIRRATTGHDAIAPRRSTRRSPLVQSLLQPPQQRHDAQTSAFASQPPPPAVPTKTSSERASILSRGSMGSQGIYRVRDSISTVESAYGEIKQATAIDEESSQEDPTGKSTALDGAVNQGSSPSSQFEGSSVVSEDDEEADAFAALLHDDDSDEDADDDFEVAEDETVSTIQQDRTAYASGVSKYSNFRLSTGEASMASGSTASTMKQHRLSFVSSDEGTSIASKESTALQFRDESLVRPNEQKLPATAKGRLRLSPMQRTPMQARKWRSLAAEAQANDRSRPSGKRHQKSSLSERHPNVAANHPWR